VASISLYQYIIPSRCEIIAILHGVYTRRSSRRSVARPIAATIASCKHAIMKKLHFRMVSVATAAGDDVNGDTGKHIFYRVHKSRYQPQRRWLAERCVGCRSGADNEISSQVGEGRTVRSADDVTGRGTAQPRSIHIVHMGFVSPGPFHCA